MHRNAIDAVNAAQRAYRRLPCRDTALALSEAYGRRADSVAALPITVRIGIERNQATLRKRLTTTYRTLAARWYTRGTVYNGGRPEDYTKHCVRKDGI